MLQNFTVNLWGENNAFLEINFQLLWNRPYGFKTLTAIQWERFWRTQLFIFTPQGKLGTRLGAWGSPLTPGLHCSTSVISDIPGKGLAGWTLDPPQAPEISAACFCAFYFTSGLCLNLWFLRTGFILLMVLSTTCTGSYKRAELSTGTWRNHGLAIHRHVYMMLPCFGRNLCVMLEWTRRLLHGKACWLRKGCDCRPARPFLELTHTPSHVTSIHLTHMPKIMFSSKHFLNLQKSDVLTCLTINSLNISYYYYIYLLIKNLQSGCGGPRL